MIYPPKEMVESEVLRFLRPLHHNFSAKLFLPAPFAEQISKSKSRCRVTLVSHNCSMWHVHLHSENKDIYLGGEGWKSFVQDNDLEIGQQLSFEFKGNNVFTFRIYDVNSCEITSRKKLIRDHVDSEEENSYSSKGQPVHCDRKREPEDQNASKAKVSNQAASSNMKRRAIEHRNASNSTKYFTDQNVYFEATIKPYNSNSLYVPKRFMESSGLSRECTGLSIRNRNGQTWDISLILNHHHARMTRAWRNFVHENQLKVGNKVRLELVSANSKEKMMHLNMLKL